MQIKTFKNIRADIKLFQFSNLYHSFLLKDGKKKNLMDNLTEIFRMNNYEKTLKSLVSKKVH